MPPRPPIADVAKVDIFWQNGTVPARTAHNIQYVAFANGAHSASQTDLQAAADGIFAGLTTPSPAIISAIQAQWFLISVTVSDIGGTTANTAVSTHAAVQCTASGVCLPPQCAAVISWKQNRRYRGGKARQYLPGIPDTALTTDSDSALTATYTNNLEAAADNYLNAVNAISTSGGTVNLATVSYRNNNAPRTTPLLFIFVGESVHRRLDSQRRRSGKEVLFGVSP